MFVSDDLAAVPLELIERELSELCGQINAGTCRWMELVAEFDRRCGWADTGCLSTADWIAWRCALSSRAAREHVRVARALAELPQIHAAFASGELSYSKVRPLTRVASAESEEDLLELARHATASQLERMLRTYRRLTRNEAKRAQERAYLAYSWDDDGCLFVCARLAPEHGAGFLRALEASRDAVWEERREETEHGSAEPQELPQEGESGGSAEPPQDAQPGPTPTRITNAEAFAAMIETARTRGPTSTSGGERYMVNVFIDADALTHDAEGRCQIGDGPALSAETARKLACDCSVVGFLERNGETVSVGRKTRTIPPALRRALIARDPKCRFPGCERRRFLDAHHLKHWADGGETSLENVAHFCRPHHDLFHEGGFTVTGDANGELEIRTPHGFLIGASPPPHPLPASPSGLGVSNHSRGHRIGPGTTWSGTGEKMDFAACVDAVFAAVEPTPS